MTDPVVIINGKRKAVIENDSVSLLKRHNKRRDTGVWPPIELPDEMGRLHIALMWTLKGFIDLPGTR